MAKRIAVLDCHQFATDAAATYVPKSVASLLVQRGQAERLAGNMIRMFPVQCNAKKASDFRATQTYIPTVLPPRELPGIFWQEPQSDQWQLDHGSAQHINLLNLVNA